MTVMVTLCRDGHGAGLLPCAMTAIGHVLLKILRSGVGRTR